MPTDTRQVPQYRLICDDCRAASPWGDYNGDPNVDPIHQVSYDYDYWVHAGAVLCEVCHPRCPHGEPQFDDYYRPECIGINGSCWCPDCSDEEE